MAAQVVQNKHLQMSASYSFSTLPDIVILHIFSYLPLRDVVVASCVSKMWKKFARLETIWKKFIPFQIQEYVLLQGKSAYEKVSHMWKNSVKVGKERWYPNPLADLEEFEKELRIAELKQLMLNDKSTMTLMLRLNPVYPLTTKGKDKDDPTIDAICKVFWDMFAPNEERAYDFRSHEDVIKHSQFNQKKAAMESILRTLQPYWFVDKLKIEPYELDEDGKIVNGGGEREDDDDDEDEDDEDEDDERNSWKVKFNKPLGKDLYEKLKAVFADNNEHFIEYYLSDGCFNENYQFAHSLVISDTAVYHIKQIFEL